MQIDNLVDFENYLKENSLNNTNILAPIMKEFNLAKQILKINNLQIYVVPRLFVGDGYLQALDDDNINDNSPNSLGCATTITEGPIYKKNIIVLSYYYFDSPQPMTAAEQLAVLLHELRHTWQQTYHAKEFVGVARGSEQIFDKSEIDADAFSMAFLTVYSHYHPSSYIEIFLSKMYADRGRRLDEADKLILELEKGLNNCK